MDLEITFGSLLAVALWEVFWPRQRTAVRMLGRRVGNIGVWLFNIILAALIFAAPDEVRAPWPVWEVAPGLSFIVGFVLLDLLIYGVHRAQHGVPWLWRLHAMHHSDRHLDWSTSVRHHPLEHLIAASFYWVAIVALGIPGPVVAVHALTVFALAVLTHGNVRWPALFERWLRPVLITLDLHRLHHSIVYEEANTNFGGVLSLWDRLFGTLRLPEGGKELVFGVRELRARAACGPLGMLATPWRI